MKHQLKTTLTALAFLLAGAPLVAFGQASPGTARMEAILKGDTSQLSPSDKAAFDSVQQAARNTASMKNVPQSVIDFSIKQSGDMQQKALEAYVAALPPRDRAIGSHVLLGDGSAIGGPGKLYFFVSRSMPISLLKAYSLAALHTGGTLVVKGIRKGDTIKEYLEEVMDDFNNADGQVLGGVEINPNLYDMFNVTMVPTVVWTNRVGLDDIGAGCQDVKGAPKKLTLTGPDDEPIEVDKPECAEANEATYYKISGALNINYILERFREAGAPKEAIARYQSLLAEQHSNVNDRNQANQTIGNAMAPIKGELHIDNMPKPILQSWQQQMATKHVMRGPYGPVFTMDGADDPVYRKELSEKISHGLGL